MAAPTIYRYSDSAAPARPTTAQGVIDILKACLVTGYGAKAAAGWSIKFEDATYIVFRNAKNDFALRITKATGAINIADDYTNITTPTGTEWQTGAGTSFTMNALPYAAANSGYEFNWCLIATDKVFYYFQTEVARVEAMGGSLTDVFRCLFCGEFIHHLASVGENAAFVCATYPIAASAATNARSAFNVSSAQPGQEGTQNSSSISGVANKGLSGTPGPARPRIAMPGSPEYSGGGYGPPRPPAAPLMLIPMWLSNFGLLKGVYGIGNSFTDLAITYNYPVMTFDGRDFLVIRMGNYSSGAPNSEYRTFILVDVGDWDA